MSAAKRSDLLSRFHKVLKKHHKPHLPPADRPLLEHLLYACCLENARPDAADQAFAILQQSYYDWNEVRVTSLTELAEVMTAVPDSAKAAGRVKRTLQSVFEEYYTFALEDVFKKLNLGEATKRIERLQGPTSFVVAYVVQHALGGHAIPVNQGALDALRITGVITEKEASEQRVPGLERAIAKHKGQEFGSLLQQLGAEIFSNPNAAHIRALLLEIDPQAKERLPKRAGKKAEAAEPTAKTAKKTPSKSGGKPKPAAPGAKKTVKKNEATKRPAAAEKPKSDTKRLSKRKPR